MIENSKRRKEIEFIESEKKRIVGYIDTIEEAIKESEESQTDDTELDIKEILEKRRSMEEQRDIDIGRERCSFYFSEGYHLADRELYEQMRDAALEKLLMVIREEISLKKEKANEMKEITIGGKNASEN